MHFENGNEAELCNAIQQALSLIKQNTTCTCTEGRMEWSRSCPWPVCETAYLDDGYQRQEGPLNDVAHTHSYAQVQG